MGDQPQNNLVASFSLPYTQADKRILDVLEERLKNCETLEQYQQTWNLLNAMKNDSLKLHFDAQNYALDVNRKKSDLFFYNIHKTLGLTIGVGLFVASFFFLMSSPILGGIFFTTGLGALGIATYSFKSLVK